MHRALESFQAGLEEQTFRAIVFDYDGTLSASRRADASPPQPIIGHLKGLIDAGVLVPLRPGEALHPRRTAELPT